MSAEPRSLEPTAPEAPPMAGAASAISALEAVARGAARLAAMAPLELAGLLADVPARALAGGDELVGAAVAADGVDATSAAAAEAWLDGPRAIALTARLALAALRDLSRGAPPRPQHAASADRDGRLVVRLASPSGAGRALHAGLRGEVWFGPGPRARDLGARTMGRWAPGALSEIALVVASRRAPLRAVATALRAVSADRRGALIVLPTGHAALAPAVERALAPLLEADLVRVVVGSATELGADARVTTVLAEGSRAEVAELASPGKPLVTSPAAIAPVIVLPTLYAADELAFQADAVATMLAWGGGFDATSARLLVVARGWAQRALFVDLVAAALARLPPPLAAPEAVARYEAALAAREDVARPAPVPPGALGWAIARDVDARAPLGPLFQADALGPALGVVAVGDDDPEAFTDAAIRLCAERVDAPVAASIVAHAHHEEDPRLAAIVDDALARLPAGVVAVAAHPWLARAIGVAPLVASPRGAALAAGVDLASLGAVGPVDRVVLRAPLRARPRPAWHASHPRRLALARALAALAATPSVFGGARSVLASAFA
jgi:aldehyde dehydrogenase (NAD(P)+)